MLPVAEITRMKMRRGRNLVFRVPQAVNACAAGNLAVIIQLNTKYADVAELADALASGASESNFMQVQVLSSAPICTISSDGRAPDS